jgi:hypothetical protein
MLPKEYVTYQDKLYWIYRKVKKTQIKEGSITDLKDFWMCDVVVKSRNQNDELLLFLREIEEVKVITDVI